MKAKMVYVAVVLALIFSMAAALTPTGPVNAAIFNIADGDVAGLITAINTANVNGEPDTINLAAGGTYILNAVDNTNNGPNGLPSINSSITINGNGATIQRNSAGGTPNLRIFHVAATGNVSMSGMTIRNGNVTGIGDGGGIYNNFGNVTLTNCTISSNEADSGGGIYNDEGAVTMTSCTVSDNYADQYGGGIYNHDGPMTMTNCTVRNNEVYWEGGGIFNEGTLEMTNCTVSENDANEEGGGIHNNVGPLTMTNCTVSGNTATEDGGGIYNYIGGSVTLTNCTVSGNTATEDGGGIYNADVGDNLTLTCTIVYGNTAMVDGPNIEGDYTDAGDNIVDEPPGSAPNPLLGPLQNNGGPTETHALMTGSPAIDACVDCTVYINQRTNGQQLVTDQRGYKRPVDGDYDGVAYCDVGAYEKQRPVGGIVEPVDRIGILAPWLGLMALMAVAMAIVVLLKRRRIA